LSARDDILAAVRRAVAHQQPHPGRYVGPSSKRDVDTFAAALSVAGGEIAGPVRADEVPALVIRHLGSGRVVAEPSAARRLGAGPWSDPPEGGAPHAFEDVDTAIAEGSIGVAENGAVAVGVEEAPHRSLLFLAERVILLLDASRITGDLHQALHAVPESARTAHHLTWICGPSKTADIEQTLVHGAHGPRSLLVVLYETPPAPKPA